MNKIKKMIYVDEDTIERLKEYADYAHVSSVSQAITTLIWEKDFPSKYKPTRKNIVYDSLDN